MAMRGVSVQFLGCGDAFGSGGRLQTCFFVDAGEMRFLLDCGASSLIGMKRWGVSPNLIDAILVSHLHGDHFGGIPFFLLDAQLVSKRDRPLIIAGPPGIAARIRDAQEVLFPGSSRTELRFAIRYIEFRESEATPIGALEATAFPVTHPSGAPAYALRVSCGGRTIAYSGDAEWTDALLRAAQGSDLFICEAYAYDKKIRFHLDYATLLRHRQALDCKRLVLTHMGEAMLSELSRVEIEVADDGKRLSL